MRQGWDAQQRAPTARVLAAQLAATSSRRDGFNYIVLYGYKVFQFYNSALLADLGRLDPALTSADNTVQVSLPRLAQGTGKVAPSGIVLPVVVVQHAFLENDIAPEQPAPESCACTLVVPQIYTGGAMCGTTPRRATVQYKCDPGLTTDTIMEAIEAPTCVYTLRVHTPRVCSCAAHNSTRCSQALRKQAAVSACLHCKAWQGRAVDPSGASLWCTHGLASLLLLPRLPSGIPCSERPHPVVCRPDRQFQRCEWLQSLPSGQEERAGGCHWQLQ